VARVRLTVFCPSEEVNSSLKIVQQTMFPTRMQKLKDVQSWEKVQHIAALSYLLVFAEASALREKEFLLTQWAAAAACLILDYA